ncbi:MAG: hypothetical protein M3Z50_10225 [Actinomycetota bacterium]|nr:hypothetical protein [Actinomycetota bacterium]
MNSEVRSIPVTCTSYDEAASRAGPPIPQPTSSSRVPARGSRHLSRYAVAGAKPACNWSTEVMSSTLSESTWTPASASAPRIAPERSVLP